MAAEIFKTQDLVFSERPPFAFAEKFPYGNDGFFAAKYDDYWRFMKRLCMVELFAPRQLQQSKVVRDEEIARILRRVMERAEKGDAIDLGLEIIKLTNNGICRMAMSSVCSEKECDDEAEKLRELIKNTLDVGLKVAFGDVLGPLKRLAFWFYGKKMIDVIMKYDEILERFMKEHEERRKIDGFERKDWDLMDILLEVYEDDNAAIKITRTHIKAFFLDLFVGGTTTSAEAMQWTIAELINHPYVLNKLRNEINSVVGSKRLIEESDVPNLPYLKAVVKEILRLYPGVPLVSRICRQNCKIQGFDVPEETKVLVNVYAIMRDPEIWENPNEFWPERFLEEQSEAITEQMDFGFVPFGGGRRRCPGSSLALLMLHATIGAMVQCFDWKLVGDEGSEVNMQIGETIGLTMAHPLVLVPVIRFNPFAKM
ncbi:hypothetical protein UlMin_005006 [Ulmus minor]